MSWPIVLIVTAVTAVAVKTAGFYNHLAGRRNAVENGFSTVDVQLKQPCDLLLRVVAAALALGRAPRGFATHGSTSLSLPSLERRHPSWWIPRCPATCEPLLPLGRRRSRHPAGARAPSTTGLSVRSWPASGHLRRPAS